MQTKTLWTIAITVLVIGLLFNLSVTKKEGVVTSLTRSVQASVMPSQEVPIDLTMTVPEKTGVIVTETIPPGWTHVTGGNLKGDTIEIVIFKSSPGYVTETYVLRAPSTSVTDSLFYGNYKTVDNVSHAITVSSVDVCSSHHSVRCYNNDEYWYNSCGQREALKLECGTDSQGTWGTGHCDSNDVYHTRTDYVKGCADNTCYVSTNTVTALKTDCPWNNVKACSGGECQGNSEGDLNKNGFVDSPELLSYIGRWERNEKTSTQLLEVIAVWEVS